MLRLYDIGGTCPICKKPSECLIADDHSCCICYHVQEGSVKRCGNAGWLHILKPGQFVPVAHVPKKKMWVNWGLRNHILKRGFDPKILPNIGIKAETLKSFGCGYSEDLWTFPMYDEKREVIGIQQRTHNSKKYTMEHSTVGIFAPEKLVPREGLLVVCEGMSDAAASCELGWPAIGKYNYSSGSDIVVKIAQNILSRAAIVVADPDPDGLWGAELTCKMLDEAGINVRMLRPPKDLRTMYLDGMTPIELTSHIYKCFNRR